jgi:acetoacetate decarboxylase
LSNIAVSSIVGGRIVKPDADKHYRTPFMMGPLFDRAAPPKLAYPQVEVLAFQFLTEPQAIESVLPEPYRPAEEPLVTVIFSDNNGLDFMAGGGYRLAAFQLAARFDGDRDHVEGDYILVMFENQTWPIIGGREDLGVPKLFADITAMKLLPDGTTRCEASLWGHLLFSLDVPEMRKQSFIARAVATRQINSRPWLAYKYVPSVDGPPDADYPTVSQNDTKIETLWLGKTASLRFGDAGRDDVALMRPLLDALATLTVVEPLRALRLEGSSVLRYDLSHRLR